MWDLIVGTVEAYVLAGTIAAVGLAVAGVMHAV